MIFEGNNFFFDLAKSYKKMLLNISWKNKYVIHIKQMYFQNKLRFIETRTFSKPKVEIQF